MTIKGIIYWRNNIRLRLRYFKMFYVLKYLKRTQTFILKCRLSRTISVMKPIVTNL